MIEIRVNGRLALTTEQAAERLGKTPSSVRSHVKRHGIRPAGYVTRNVPVYYPEDLNLEETPMRYTTRQDAIDQAVIPALGSEADDYDVEAICDEAYAYRVDTNEAGQELLNTAGFEQVVTDGEFWDIVAKHDRTA